jgi:hypothetical protein
MEEGYKAEAEQLRRLKEERDKWWQVNIANKNLSNVVVSLFVFTLFVFIVSQYITSLFGIDYLLLGITVAAVLSYGYSAITNSRREPMFVCPKLECRTPIPALHWQCPCGKVNTPASMRSTGNLAKPPTLGEPCLACKTLVSHYICPKCDTRILLDASRPETRAATWPDYVWPKGKEKHEKGDRS